MNVSEKKIIEVIKRGIPLLEKGSVWSYMRDGWEEVTEEEKDSGDYEVLTSDHLLRFVYDSDDKMTEALEQNIETTIYASSHMLYMDYIPATEVKLSPVLKQPLTPGYPEQFFWWLEDLISAFNNYGKQELINVFENYGNENR